MITTGDTAIEATTDAPVVAISMPSNGYFRNMKELYIVNDGAGDGFVSIDGVTWIRIPAQSSRQFRGLRCTDDIRIKRVAGGTDMTGVYIAIW